VYARPSEQPRFEAVRVEKLDRGVKVRLFDTRKESWLDDELHTLGSEPRVGSIIEVAEVRAVYVGAKDIRPRFEAVRVEKLDRGVKVRLFDTRKESWLDDELHTLGSEPSVGTIIEVAELWAVYVGAKNISGATEPVR
jgi:hypothetical protein